MPEYRSASGSSAEDLFIELFADTFGAEKAGYLYSQYPFYDIYQNARFADFVLENGSKRIAIEIDKLFLPITMKQTNFSTMMNFQRTG